jgi:glycerol-3-phosphate dehydrogenase
MLSFSAATRTVNLARMAQDQFDVLVIGGGITGAGIALDAAARGFWVALVEKDDFASGTSGRSSRLVHGGLRYLEHREFGLVRESLRERGLLFRLAPHLVRPAPMYMLAGDRRSRALYGFGLAGYDLLAAGQNIGVHRSVTASQIRRAIPGLAGESRGYRYFECQTDDARLTIEVARAAHAFGAVLANHVRAEALLGGARVAGAVAADALTGQRFEIRARVTVNAAGVWADRVGRLAAAGSIAGRPRLLPSKGVHLVFAPGAVRAKAALAVPSAAGDGRFVFLVPWDDRVYAGTTDTPYSGDLDDPAVEDSDRDYILATVARDFPGVTERDVVASWAGLRPLLNSPGQGGAAADARTADLSRRHVVFEDLPGLFTITGGKLTTYRAMAEDLVDRISGTLGPRGRCATRSIPLGLHGPAGTALGLAAAETARLGLPPGTGARLVARYGDDWREAVRLIGQDPALGAQAVDGLPVLNVELELARNREMAITAEDVFVRRTRLTTRDASVRLPGQLHLQADRRLDDLERGWRGAQRLAVRLDPERRVGFDSQPAGPQFCDVAVGQVRASVDLRQRGEGIGLRAHHDQDVERAVVRLGLGRDLHAASVEPAVRHHHVVRPPLVGLAVRVDPHGSRAEARQRQPEPGQVPGGSQERREPGGPGDHRPAQAGFGDVGEVPGCLRRALGV